MMQDLDIVNQHSSNAKEMYTYFVLKIKITTHVLNHFSSKRMQTLQWDWFQEFV